MVLTKYQESVPDTEHSTKYTPRYAAKTYDEFLF